MSEPIQASLPMIGPAKLVVGPVFLRFELEGKPGHKGRHRSRLVIPKDAWSYPRDPKSPRYMTEAGVRKIFVHMYADPATEAEEKVIKEYAGLLMRHRAPSTRPMAMLVYAFRKIPDSWSAREKEAALAGAILPTPRPDSDNHMKLVKDALNGVTYVDDAQVCDERCIKQYSDTPALWVELREFVEP